MNKIRSTLLPAPPAAAQRRPADFRPRVKQTVAAWPPGMHAALRLLLEARCHAETLGFERWDFAVAIQILQAAGLSNTDLRWLVQHGYVHHAQERTPTNRKKRAFGPLGPLVLTKRTCFVMSDAGMGALQVLPGGRALAALEDRGPTLVPQWDAELRELRIAGQLVKRFQAPASNQELILAAFAEQGWPAQIDDPLPPEPGLEPKRRLNQAINCLNRNQKRPLLRFRGAGNGTKLRWQRLESR